MEVGIYLLRRAWSRLLMGIVSLRLPCFLLVIVKSSLSAPRVTVASDSTSVAPILDPPGASDSSTSLFRDLRIRTDVLFGRGRSDDPATISPRFQTHLSAVTYYRFLVGLHMREIGMTFRYDGNRKQSQAPDTAYGFHNSFSHAWEVYLTGRVRVTRWLNADPFFGYTEVLDYVVGEREDGTITYYRERRGSGPLIGLEGVLRAGDRGRIRATYYQGIHRLRDRRFSLEYLMTNMGKRPGSVKESRESVGSPDEHPHVGYFVLGCQIGVRDDNRFELVGFVGLGLIGRLLP